MTQSDDEKIESVSLKIYTNSTELTLPSEINELKKAGFLLIFIYSKHPSEGAH